VTKGKKIWRGATVLERDLYFKEKFRLAEATALKIIEDANGEAKKIIDIATLSTNTEKMAHLDRLKIEKAAAEAEAAAFLKASIEMAMTYFQKVMIQAVSDSRSLYVDTEKKMKEMADRSIEAIAQAQTNAEAAILARAATAAALQIAQLAQEAAKAAELRAQLVAEAEAAIKAAAEAAIAKDCATRPSSVRAGLAYDIGGRGDKSFNDSAAVGLELAKTRLCITGQEMTITTGSDSEREDKLRLLAKAGYNPIIAVGFLYAGPLKKVASDYPNVQFGIIDDSSVDLLNVAGLVFAEEQGSYLAGVTAALASKSGKVGYIGAVRVPLLQKFEAGFVAGVKATKKSVTVDVKYVTEPPNFSGFNDPAMAQVIAKGMIDKGVDVIFEAAGQSRRGLFTAALDSKVSGTKVWVIGSDYDHYQSVSTVEQQNILTSVLKRIDIAVYDVIATAVAGSSVNDVLDESGIYGRRYGLSRFGISLSRSGGFLDPYLTQIEEVEKAIRSGQIVVPTKPG
jgi:basic membrane protein A